MSAILSLIFLFPLAALSQWEFESDNTLMGVHRAFPNGASESTDYKESFLETLTGYKYKSDHFQMEAKVLVRSILSPANKNRDDFAFTNLTPPRRILKFYTEVGGAADMNQMVIDTGSLWGSYNKDNWQFTIGRRAIGIGVLKAFPVWNRLYPVVPTVSGYMLKNNPDMLDVRWSKDQWTIAGYSIFSQFYDESINAIEFIHYGEKLESHMLLSKWWNQATAGYSGALDSDYGIFRLESLLIAQGAEETMGGFQYGVGWERAFTERLSFLAEYYHSSFGEKDPNHYLLQDPTPFRTLLARDYVYPQVIYKFTDFLTNVLGVITNLNDGSSMVTNETSYSLSDNVEVFGTIRKPLGNEGEEFGHLNVPVTNQSVEYSEWVSVGLKMTI